MMRQLDPATAEGILTDLGIGRGDVGASPLLLVARDDASIVWANEAARSVLAGDDARSAADLLFRTTASAQGFARRLATMRVGTEARLERLRYGGSWMSRPLLAACRAVDVAAVGSLVLLRFEDHDAANRVGDDPYRSAYAETGGDGSDGGADEPPVAAAPQARDDRVRVLWETDPDGIVLNVSPAFDRLIGATALHAGDHLAARLRLVDAALAEAVEGVLAGQGSVAASQIDWPGRNDRAVRVEVGCARRPAGGGLRGFCLVHAPAGDDDAPVPTAAAASAAPEPANDDAAPVETPVPAAPEIVVAQAADPGPDASAASVRADRFEDDPPPRADNIVHFPVMRIASVAANFGQELRSAPAVSSPVPEVELAVLEAPRWSETPEAAPSEQAPGEPAPSEPGLLNADEQDAFRHIGQVLGTRPVLDRPGTPATAQDKPDPAGRSETPNPVEALGALFRTLAVPLLWGVPGAWQSNDAYRAWANDDGTLPNDAPPIEHDGGVLGGSDRLRPDGMRTIRLGDQDIEVATVSASEAVKSRSAHGGSDTMPVEAILDLAADGHVRVDPAGIVLGASAGAARLFDTEPDTLVGRPLVSFAAVEDEERWRGLMAAGSETKGTLQEVTGRTRNGQPVSLAARSARMADGETVVFFFDDAHRRRALSGLEAARREAERTSSLKSEFLAKVSHEIRTPLNAILGFTEVIRDERLGPIGNSRYLDYLRDIHASGTHVMSLVNDLLDLSRIEAGRMDLNLDAVDANEVVNGCVSAMQTEAHRERIIVRLSLSPGLPAALADRRSVRQIVLNLLSNAIKFNEPGGQVIVSTALAEAGSVAIRIRDTGVGMTDDEIEIAMEPFRQVSTTNHAGSGLGLPLTKALVEANCASMAIRSTPGQGTLVEVTFPVVESNSLSRSAE